MWFDVCLYVYGVAPYSYRKHVWAYTYRSSLSAKCIPDMYKFSRYVIFHDFLLSAEFSSSQFID